MNLWHDKSYITPSGPEWVERGYAMYDVHSVRFQFVYTEEQKKANRRAHTAADEGQALVMAAEVRNSIMEPVMDAIAQNFVCYQYEDTEPAPFGSCQWDLFFWCNGFSNTLESDRGKACRGLLAAAAISGTPLPEKPQSGCCRPVQHLVRP